MPASVEAELLASGGSVGVVARKIAGRENRGAHGPIAHRGGLAELLEVANIGEHLHMISNEINQACNKGKFDLNCGGERILPKQQTGMNLWVVLFRDRG